MYEVEMTRKYRKEHDLMGYEALLFLNKHYEYFLPKTGIEKWFHFHLNYKESISMTFYHK